VEWEVFVDAAEAGDEMIFEGTYGAFGGIAAVYAGWGKLEVDVFLTEELFKRFSTFVVEALEAWAEAGGTKGGVEGLVAVKD
jgi:hypothetical protein